MPDSDHIEFASTVWSRTHQDSKGFRGGCVIEIDPVAGTVEVIETSYTRRPPKTTTLAIEDLDHELTEFHTRNAGIHAGNLFAWLGSANARERSNNASWAELAVRLQIIKDSGSLTPRAEARYQADLRERLGK